MSTPTPDALPLDPRTRRAAEAVFEQLGLSASEAVALFYRHVGQRGSLPEGMSSATRRPRQRRSTAADARRDHVYTLAVETLGDDARARSWLARPNEALGGRPPADLIGTPHGAREVEAVLVRIGHGVYS